MKRLVVCTYLTMHVEIGSWAATFPYKIVGQELSRPSAYCCGVMPYSSLVAHGKQELLLKGFFGNFSLIYGHNSLC
jgi:hypothetical protein